MNKKNLILVWTFFTSILLVVSAYAWFSSNRILGFRSFNIHVASKGGIEISTDAFNWKGVLTLADLIDANKIYTSSRNQVPSKLEPVSTSGDIENGFLKMFYGKPFKGGKELTDMIASERTVEVEGFGEDSKGLFVAFDLFFKNPGTKTLYLTPQSVIEPVGVIDSGIENAFRVAFLYQGTLPSDTALINIQRLSSAKKAYIWEPNYDTHTKYGVENAYNRYGIITKEFDASQIGYSGLTSSFEEDANVVISKGNPTNYPDKFKNVNVDIASKKNFNNHVEIFNVEPGVSKVRVYIWIEGQDVDCEKNASLADVSINLQISTEPS